MALLPLLLEMMLSFALSPVAQQVHQENQVRQDKDFQEKKIRKKKNLLKQQVTDPPSSVLMNGRVALSPALLLILARRKALQKSAQELGN